jgi:hypothetical protein
MRIGDEIMEIDGNTCQAMLEEEVTELLGANEGTITMLVQFSYDYQRTLGHRRKVDLQSKLFVLSRRLLELERQERHIQRAIDRRNGLDAPDTSDAGSVSSSSGARRGPTIVDRIASFMFHVVRTPSCPTLHPSSVPHPRHR